MHNNLYFSAYLISHLLTWNFIHHFTGQPFSLRIFQQYFTVNHHLCCLEKLYFNRQVWSLTLPVFRGHSSIGSTLQIPALSCETPWQHSPTLFPISLPIVCTSQDLLSFAVSAQVPGKVFWTLSRVLQKSSTSSFILIYIFFKELQGVCKTNILPSYKPHWLFPNWLCLSHCQTYFCLLQLLLVYVLQMPSLQALGFLDPPKPFFKD